MIKEFVDVWDAHKGELEDTFRAEYPGSYQDIVEAVVTLIHKYLHDVSGVAYSIPDPTRITSIDHGDYQGTLLFIIADTSYQPDDFWFVKVSYGSCSGCDTLQSIEYGPDDDKLVDYMTLALHILQGLTVLSDSEDYL